MNQGRDILQQQKRNYKRNLFLPFHLYLLLSYLSPKQSHLHLNLNLLLPLVLISLLLRQLKRPLFNPRVALLETLTTVSLPWCPL